MTALSLRPNLVHCLKGSCDQTQSYISRTKRHLAMRIQEHLSVKSEKSAIQEHIRSCKDCHTCSISNFYALAQANTDYEAKIKEALYVKIYSKINQPKLYMHKHI